VKELRALFRARMQQLGLTTNQVSLRLEGISRPVLYEFLNGRRDVSISSILCIADALGMQVKIVP
jgi:hypothetical protein